MERDGAVGLVLQSPLTFAATLKPTDRRITTAMVDVIAAADVFLPRANGDAATAASFAGHWSKRRKTGATPFQGDLLYELLK